MWSPPIVVRKSDAQMIRGLPASPAATSNFGQLHLEQLRAGLDRAVVLASVGTRVSRRPGCRGDAVTLDSRLTFGAR